jgi:hypothetical protein
MNTKLPRARRRGVPRNQSISLTAFNSKLAAVHPWSDQTSTADNRKLDNHFAYESDGTKTQLQAVSDIIQSPAPEDH